MLLKQETHNIQTQLAEYCKTGVEVEIKGAKQDRLHHYRRLTYNIVKGALNTAYPIAQKTIDEDVWKGMIDDYYANHKMNTPLVWKMPLEFYKFVVEQKYAVKLGMPYLDDLLYFEWIEIEIHTMSDIEIPNFKDKGDLLNDKLIVTPEHEILSFDYPVHKFKGNNLLDKEGSYFILIFRKHDTGAVRFINLSPFFAVTLQNIIEQQFTFNQSIEATAKAFGVDYDQSVQHGLAFANELVAQGFILGYEA